MLFKVIHGEDIFVTNPELLSVEIFKNLTDRQLKYVILSTDYKSPFKKLPLDQRKYQAAVEAGFRLEKDGKRLDMNGRNLVAGKVSNIEAAILRYKELQKDEDYEALLSVGTLIAQIRELNIKADKSVQELDKAVTMTLKLPQLVKSKKEIEEILDMREDEPAPDATMGSEDGDETVDEASLPLLSKLNQGML